MAEKVRIQKYLSACGVASRRKAESMIEAGEVRVNGRTAALGDKVDPAVDAISVKGRRIRAKKTHTYIALYKPRGVVSTMSDESGRRCVAELVADVPTRIYPVGRLDRNSEGLLLMTDDGALTNALSHPSGHVPKTYRVTIRPGITGKQLEKLSEGVVLDGRPTLPAEVRVLERQENRTVLEIVLREGRNRQIRRMLESLGIETARLKRTAVGPVRLGMLGVGKWRELTPQETEALRKAAGLSDDC